MIKKIFFIFIIVFTANCGFTPIINNENKINYTINIIEKNGDKLINNLLSSELKKISNSDANKIINLKINSSYDKIVISRDSKGNASDYQVTILTQFVIENNKISKKISFEDKQNLNSISDIFEQKNYENIIRKNFAVSIARKLNLELLSQK